MELRNNSDLPGVQVRFIRLPATGFTVAFLYSPVYFHHHIIAITKGEAEIVYGTTLLTARTTHLCTLPVDCYIRPAGGQGTQFWMLRLTEHYMARALYKGNSSACLQLTRNQPSNLKAEMVTFKIIKKLLLLLDKHQQYNKSGNSELIVRLAFNLLISCLNELAASPAMQTMTKLRRKEYIAIEFLRLAEKKAKEHHSVHYYAGLLCMTQGNLTKIVKEVTAKTPKALIEEILVRMAKELLDYSLSPIYLVADELNFKSSSAFINFFRNQTGTTPNEYRNRKLPLP